LKVSGRNGSKVRLAVGTLYKLVDEEKDGQEWDSGWERKV
jgi:hypothetical protein